jgi:hypothetical protein
VSPADLKPHLQAILGNLFDILEAKKGGAQQLAENDHVMKSKSPFFPFFVVFSSFSFDLENFNIPHLRVSYHAGD